MAQAQFLIVEPTFRESIIFDEQTGQKKRYGHMCRPGSDKDGNPLLYICDEEEAPKHALSVALKPLNDEAKKAYEIAKARKAKQDAERSLQSGGVAAGEIARLREELAEMHKVNAEQRADLRAAIEALKSKK